MYKFSKSTFDELTSSRLNALADTSCELKINKTRVKLSKRDTLKILFSLQNPFSYFIFLLHVLFYRTKK